MPILVSLLFVGLLFVTLSLYTCIIVDIFHYVYTNYRTTNRWLGLNWKDVCTLGGIAVFVLGYSLYQVQPQDIMSLEMQIDLCLQVFYLVIGISLHKRVSALMASVRCRLPLSIIHEHIRG